MPDINISSQDTGSCPYCRYEGECHIIDTLIEILEREVSDNYDDQMELVIYRCPEFEPQEIESDEE